MSEAPSDPTPAHAPPPAPTPAAPDRPVRVRGWLRTSAILAALGAVMFFGGCNFLLERTVKHRVDFNFAGDGPFLQFTGVVADMSTRAGLPESTAPAPGSTVAKPVAAVNSADAHWPGWRGRNGQGTVAGDKPLPTQWSRAEGVLWRTEIPGVGHSSPVVWGDRVYVTTSQDSGRTRSLIGLDRKTGSIVVRGDPVEDPDPGPVHSKHGHASSTPVTDGRRIVAFFGRAGLAAFDMEGKRLWRADLGAFTGGWGTASSPIVYGDNVILCVDDDAQCFIAAYRLEDGKQVWRTRRDQDRSFSTPLVVETADGARELVINGKGRVWAYDPDTGAELWVCDGMMEWVTPTVVAGHGLVFATCGRNGPTLAIRPGGRGNVTKTHVAWKSVKGGPYIPSPVLYGDHLYMCNDNGILAVYEAKTGNKVHQARLGGDHTASAIAGGGHVYFVSEQGNTYVVKAGDGFPLVATNGLGERVLASPAVAEGVIYLRTDEALYAVGR